MNPLDCRGRLIFALDVDSRPEAERLIKELDGVVDFFKIGITLFTGCGPELVSRVLKQGRRVFLDLKFFDIGEQVRGAVSQVARLGVQLLTVHGDTGIIKAAVAGKAGSRLKILAVTLLTSMDSAGLAEIGFQTDVEKFVLYRSRKALECGCDGVVCSGREAAAVRRECGDKLLIVTPGIRPSGAATAEQKRWVTPSDAIRNGADYLVVGRPIRDAVDPRQAAQDIIQEMRDALLSKTTIGGTTPL